MSENYSDVNLYMDSAAFAVASLLIKMASNASVYYWVHFDSDKNTDNRLSTVMTFNCNLRCIIGSVDRFSSILYYLGRQ